MSRAELVRMARRNLAHVKANTIDATGLRQQRALLTGARSHVLFGRNEGGGQRFHRLLERLLACDDAELRAELQ